MGIITWGTGITRIESGVHCCQNICIRCRPPEFGLVKVQQRGSIFKIRPIWSKHR